MSVRLERLGLLAVLALAAVTRLPGLASRGRFDADQGHDMLVLLGMTQGALPLLGPRTSVGEFHHGAFYYYLLSPAAFISGTDPVVVTAWLAVLGIAAVALTWWLARSVAGPLAGLIAGLLLAASPAAIEQSTFIWNPNPIPLFAALALGAAWQGRQTGRAGWWALAIGAAVAVVQLHVLGIVFLAGIVAIVALAARAAGAAERAAIARGAAGGLALGILLFLPLIVHELQTGFLETGRIAAYLASGDTADGGGLGSALVFTLLRVVGWPLVGLVTDVPPLGAVVVGVVVALGAWSVVAARGPSRAAAGWLVGLLAWSVIALAVTAPSLQRVVAGLPNDHSHAFADPLVAVLVALAAATLLERATGTAAQLRALLRVGVAVGIGLIVVVEVARWPPAADPDGGWVAARDAGASIAAATGGGAVILLGLPDFKGTDGIGYPIVAAGADVVPLEAGLDRADAVVVACDRLFETVIGASCGGPAEDRLMRARLTLGAGQLPFAVSRFDASPRTAISIYAPR
ncbi:MAG TPA: hypothetical protein VK831_06330 [Candidatus Deferrimicrobiaceae bacterium]|nr:hypothetical protein [Candidatus Deferrimicrobiaceae bacterium]